MLFFLNLNEKSSYLGINAEKSMYLNLHSTEINCTRLVASSDIPVDRRGQLIREAGGVLFWRKGGGRRTVLA